MGAAAALVYPATLAILNSVFTNPRERATAIGIPVMLLVLVALLNRAERALPPAPEAVATDRQRLRGVA